MPINDDDDDDYYYYYYNTRWYSLQWLDIFDPCTQVDSRPHSVDTSPLVHLCSHNRPTQTTTNSAATDAAVTTTVTPVFTFIYSITGQFLADCTLYQHHNVTCLWHCALWLNDASYNKCLHNLLGTQYFQPTTMTPSLQTPQPQNFQCSTKNKAYIIIMAYIMLTWCDNIVTYIHTCRSLNVVYILPLANQNF